MAQQKQRKQFILTEDKNTFTYCFQPIQRLQLNFKTDGIKNFMYTMHNKNNAKLRIFSFILQRQRIQPNITNHTNQTTKHTNTNWTTKTTISTWVSPLTQSLCSCNWDNTNSGVFIFKLRNKSTNFVHFIHHQFVHFIDPEKSVHGLMNSFVRFIHTYLNLLPDWSNQCSFSFFRKQWVI